MHCTFQIKKLIPEIYSKVAVGIKLKRMNKYQKEWLAIKETERQREDPVIRLERENKKLLADNMRLDTENDNLARELVNRYAHFLMIYK